MWVRCTSSQAQVFFPCAWAKLHEGSQASGTEGAGSPMDRASQERECGCSLSPRLPQSLFPISQGPIPHPHSMPHALSSPGCCAHLPDTHICTHCLPHHHVCAWALGCHGFTCRQTAGFCLPRGWEAGAGESDVEAPTSVLLPSRSCTPPFLFSCMPASMTSGAKGLGPAKDRT